MASPRTHRSLTSAAPSKERKDTGLLRVTVEAVTARTLTLNSKETGIFKYPLSAFQGPLPKAGDEIPLTLGSPPKEKPDLNDLRALLQELVG